MMAISSMLGDWSQAGAAVEVVPKSSLNFLQVCDLTPQYMRQHKLTPSDAAHLALAETHAKTFVTADSDFERVARQATSQDLVVVHLLPQ
ncbi:MAG: PIN domain-containing protein [Dehalococcoidia bacterium]